MILLSGFGATPAAAQPTIVFDYSLDTNNFFGAVGSAQRLTLGTAAVRLTSRLTDTLTAITPSGVNTWDAVFPNPATGSTQTITNLTIPQNTIRVYAGGRVLGGSTLGFGGPGGFSASGDSQAFFDAVVGRGQAGALVAPASRTDFGPWGGAITFDNSAGRNWNFGLTAPSGSQADFLSVAEHELGHLLGFGTSDSFRNRAVGTTFTGPLSTTLNGGVNPSVTADKGHWAEGTSYLGQETAMDPSILLGTRKEFTELDYAGLSDLGWQLAPVPEPATVVGLSAVGLAGAWGVRRRAAAQALLPTAPAA